MSWCSTEYMFCLFFFFLLMIRRPPRSTRTDTSFPTRRSSDLQTFFKVISAVYLQAFTRWLRNRHGFRGLPDIPCTGQGREPHPTTKRQLGDKTTLFQA